MPLNQIFSMGSIRRLKAYKNHTKPNFRYPSFEKRDRSQVDLFLQKIDGMTFVFSLRNEFPARFSTTASRMAVFSIEVDHFMFNNRPIVRWFSCKAGVFMLFSLISRPVSYIKSTCDLMEIFKY